MGKIEKTLGQVLRGSSDNNVNFQELCSLLLHLLFRERIKGSHHIFTADGVDEILNLQPNGNKAKPYQVRQVRNVITKYDLADDSTT